MLQKWPWCAALAGILLCAAATAEPVSSETLKALEPLIAAGKLGRIAAVRVEQHGKLVYSRDFLGGGPIDIRSAGKSLTALAVGTVIADGKLAGTQVAVWPYLNAARGDGHVAITVRDLLAMSSALDCNDAERRSPGQEERMYRTKRWADFALALPLRTSWKRDATGLGPFSYCTAGAFLLGRVVEKATGQPFDVYVQQRLLDPLEITPPTWRRSPAGEIQSGGQLRINADDLVKIGRLVLDRGQWHGTSVVPTAWLKDMLHPWRQLGPNVYYGYLWWAMPIRDGTGATGAWMMQGNGGNVVALVGKRDAVIVVQAENYNRADADANSFRILSAALADLDAR